ncbi:MAG: glycosyltransferase family 39 protein [Anaerolineae bacterium]|nr:glycosyltransferase family 39 protein [Anaerolineae bacterium]
MRYLRLHWRLLVVLLIYVIIATVHSLIVPLSTGNDEWAHFLYLRFIAENGRLPVTPEERDEAGYKSDAPPLYHLLVSVVTAGVEPTRLLRPIDSPRRELADNWVNPYALVHTGVELPPYRGEVLGWHLGRGVSILFGGILIVIVYLTGSEILGNCRRALLAAALLAFVPAFVFHSSVLSYESLSATLTALFLLVVVKIIKRPQQWYWWPILGILAGLSLTAKYSALLLALEIGFIAWLVFQVVKKGDKSPQPKSLISISRRYLIALMLLAMLALFLAASWWFGFVIFNFNKIETHGPVVGALEPLLVGDASDTTSVSVGKLLFGQTTVVATERPLLERNYGQILQLLLNSFWAAPVAKEFVLSPWLALLISLIAMFGLVGLGRIWQKNQGLDRIWLMLLIFHSLLIMPLLVIRLALSFDPREVAQGRHLLLPAASAIPLLLVWGWSQWRYKISQIVVVGLLLWSGLGQVGWAAMVYPPPLPVWTERPSVAKTTAQPLDQTFANALHLTSVAWQETPGQESLAVTLWWKALAPMPADYLIELNLLDQQGRLISYSVGQPVQGRYPTRAWEPGDVVKDVHWLPLIGPLNGNYQLQLRLLNRVAQPIAGTPLMSLGQVSLTIPAHPVDPCAVWFEGRPNRGGLLIHPYRLDSSFTVIAPNLPTLKPIDHLGRPEQTPLVSAENFHVFMVGPDWAEKYQLFVGSTACHQLAFDLPPRQFAPPAISQTLSVNFNDQVKLLGYELPTRRIQPGERLPLTLYWQALTYMGEDYQIFDNLLDSQQRRWGGYDRRAKDGYSTLLWTPGEVITDAFGVPVEPAAPDGIYTLDIGLYRQTGEGAASLPLVVDGQPVEQTGVRLGPIKVGGPPPEVVAKNPAPQTIIHRSLGEQITLLGYDLTDPAGQFLANRSAPLSTLNLTLYWQADTSPPVDYTTFVHLRNAANQTVAQKDAPPANGQYPTSLWDPGETIIDNVSLLLPDISPGNYTLVIGLYELTTGERLSVPGNPANEITLEAIELP